MTSKINKTQQAFLTRRQFLGRMSVGLAGAFGVTALTYLAYSDDPVYSIPEKIYNLPDFRIDAGAVHARMVITHGTDQYRMVKTAVDKLGGIKKFIKPGDRVVIKPNVAWDRMPEQAANTNPDVVSAVVRIVKEGGPSKIIVTDVSLNDPYRAFSRSGVKAAAEKAGAKVWIPSDDDFILADLKGELLRVWPVNGVFLEADKVINVPVVKHHSLSQCTLAMKNWYGVLGGQRNQLHQDIHSSIADLAQAMRPTLTVMDATRVLMRNGPTGGSISDVLTHNTIIVGLDEVAMDAYGMGILGVVPTEVGFMEIAQRRGLGLIEWKSLGPDELTV